MTTLSESTMARSRCTTVVSRLSCGSYSTSATSVGSAGRGDTQSRPSPTWGGLTIWGPSARGLAASVVSGLPTGAGAHRRQAERLTRDLDRILTDDEGAYVHRALEQEQREQERRHGTGTPSTRVATRS